MRCQACGHQNPEGNSFCGQCGSALPRRRDAGAAAPAKPAQRTPQQGAAGGGPSYLGLGVRYREEQQQARSRGGWRWVVALVFLIVAAGLLWLQWRRNYPNAPAETAQLQQAPLEAEPRQPPAAATSRPAAEPEAADEVPPPQPEQAAATPALQPSPTPAVTRPEKAETPPASEERRAESVAPPAATPPEPEPPEEPVQQPRAAAQPPAREAQSQRRAETTEPEAPAGGGRELEIAQRHLAGGEGPRDPAEASRWLWKAMGEGNPEAPVLLAELYLRGDGVKQSCEQAVVLLNAAARKPNPRARAQLGRLHAAGQCVPQDRMAAYHWLTLALAGDPDNTALRQERERLWLRMNELERQEARALEGSTLPD